MLINQVKWKQIFLTCCTATRALQHKTTWWFMVIHSRVMNDWRHLLFILVNVTRQNVFRIVFTPIFLVQCVCFVLFLFLFLSASLSIFIAWNNHLTLSKQCEINNSQFIVIRGIRMKSSNVITKISCLLKWIKPISGTDDQKLTDDITFSLLLFTHFWMPHRGLPCFP